MGNYSECRLGIDSKAAESLFQWVIAIDFVWILPADFLPDLRIVVLGHLTRERLPTRRDLGMGVKSSLDLTLNNFSDNAFYTPESLKKLRVFTEMFLFRYSQTFRVDLTVV